MRKGKSNKELLTTLKQRLSPMQIREQHVDLQNASERYFDQDLDLLEKKDLGLFQIKANSHPARISSWMCLDFVEFLCAILAIGVFMLTIYTVTRYGLVAG